jgi:hypothetical protein
LFCGTWRPADGVNEYFDNIKASKQSIKKEAKKKHGYEGEATLSV